MNNKNIESILRSSKNDIGAAWDQAVDIIRELQARIEELEEELEEAKSQANDL